MSEARWYVVHTYSGYENKVAEIVDIPEGQQVAALIAVGYPAEGIEVAVPPRKDASVLLSFVE